MDLRTQASFQLLDAGFVGLIFACFDQSRSGARVGSVALTAFQARPAAAAAGSSCASSAFPSLSSRSH